MNSVMQPPSISEVRRSELLVDLSVIAQQDAGTGIQRVVRAVYTQLRALPLRDFRLRPVAAAAGSGYRYLPDDVLERAGCSSADGSVESGLVAPQPGDVFLGLDLASAIMPRHEAQLAAWRRASVEIHIFVFDMLPLLHPEWFRRPARKHYRRWIRLIERQADQIICNAEEVRDQFVSWNRRWWRPRSARTVRTSIVPLSGEIAASVPSMGIPVDADRILAWIARQPTVLMIGTVEPRKGYDQALAAFELLWKHHGEAGPALLVAGRPGWKTCCLQHRMRKRSGFDGPFLWLDDVSDEFLEILYRQASGLLFASRGEGYGLPVVEALAHGLPILVRDLPVLGGNLTEMTTTFAGETPRQLAVAIKSWLTALEQDGHRRTVREPRTWHAVVRDLLGVLGIEVEQQPGTAVSPCGTVIELDGVE